MTHCSPQSDPIPARFVVFVGAVFAMGSLGIDTILPALPAISSAFAVDGNAIQFLVTGFVLGMGFGNVLGGPVSDRYGRRPVILAGCALYAVASLAALALPTISLVIAARFLQGIGASLAYVATTALVRDRFEGDRMARLMSFAMMIFATMPALAPLMGGALVATIGWPAIFVTFAVLSALLGAFAFLSIAETLEHRDASLSVVDTIRRGRDVLAIAAVRIPIMAQVFNMAILFGVLASIQPIFDKAFGRASTFPFYFALLALAVLVSGFVNGRMVQSTGAARLVRTAFLGQVVSSLIVAALFAGDVLPSDVVFWIFLAWAIGVFLMHGFTMGNLNALAMDPIGNMAGIGSSVVASTTMIIGTMLAIPVGLLFDGTATPLIMSVLLFSILGFAIASRLRPKPSPGAEGAKA